MCIIWIIFKGRNRARNLGTRHSLRIEIEIDCITKSPVFFFGQEKVQLNRTYFSQNTSLELRLTFFSEEKKTAKSP